MDVSNIRILGPHEVQEMLGFSRQWSFTIMNRRDFPEPRWTLKIGKVWLADDVEAWIAENRPAED